MKRLTTVRLVIEDILLSYTIHNNNMTSYLVLRVVGDCRKLSDFALKHFADSRRIKLWQWTARAHSLEGCNQFLVVEKVCQVSAYFRAMTEAV